MSGWSIPACTGEPDPNEVWLTQYDTGSPRLRYVKTWADDAHGFAVVEDDPKHGFITFFVPSRQDYLDDHRVGLLVVPAR